jgi:hypothetical protein
VIHRAFDNWSSHLNWAGTQIQFKYPWLYYSDADEIVPEDLRAEIHRIAGDPNQSCAAYRLRYKNYFMGRWIKHCGIYPVWVLRFYRPESVRWERLVNPTAVVEGDSGRLASHFHHFSFRKGISSWVEKHNQYSTNEAIESIRSLDHRSIPWKDIFQRRDPAARRVALKELSFRMPYRSSLRFLYMYILKLGFLDGIPGYHYCKLLSFYEYLISLKIHELRHSDSTGVRRDED